MTAKKPRKPSPDRLEQARKSWEAGDWADLAEPARAASAKEDAGGGLSLLQAAGLAQLGQFEAARAAADRALVRGAPRAEVARVLLSGAYNTLGRIASLHRDAAHAQAHFDTALALVQPDSGTARLARARQTRETARLGLLDQAVTLVENETQSGENAENPLYQSLFADLEVIKREMRMLRKTALNNALQTGARAPERRARADVPAPFIVVIAGVPRSGSTWLYNATRLLIEQARLSYYAEWVEDYKPADHPDCDIHIVKLHNAEQLNFDHHRILTSYRDLIERLASLIRMGWLKEDPVAIRRSADAHATLAGYWTRRSDYEADYGDILENPARVLREIAAVLEVPCTAKRADAIAARLAAFSGPKSTNSERGHDARTLLHQGHRASAEERRRYVDIVEQALAAPH